jgi:uncharacterized membrane protein
LVNDPSGRTSIVTPYAKEIVPMGNIQTQINKLFSDLAGLGTGVIVGTATVAIMVGGLMWLFSAGSQRRVEHAQTTILAGIGGLVIVLLANTIASGVRGVFGG